jgi:hypothetical protein
MSTSDKQEILQNNNLHNRAILCLKQMDLEFQKLSLKNEVQSKVRNVIDEVTYSDEAPWPDQADGNGAFLQLADINADNSLAENWAAMVDFNSLSNKGEVSSRILVYPNPVSSLLYVSLTNGRKIEKVNIYDLSGKLILSYSSSEKRDVFDLEPLNSGVYLIEIKTDSSIFTERIIRQ